MSASSSGFRKHSLVGTIVAVACTMSVTPAMVADLKPGESGVADIRRLGRNVG
jgi:hypothetical protein